MIPTLWLTKDIVSFHIIDPIGVPKPLPSGCELCLTNQALNRPSTNNTPKLLAFTALFLNLMITIAQLCKLI